MLHRFFRVLNLFSPLKKYVAGHFEDPESISTIKKYSNTLNFKKFGKNITRFLQKKIKKLLKQIYIKY